MTFSIIAKPRPSIAAYKTPSTILSNSSFFQRNRISSASPLVVSSTNGADITALNISPATSPSINATASPPAVFKIAETAVATTPPQMNAPISIQVGSGSNRSIHTASRVYSGTGTIASANPTQKADPPDSLPTQIASKPRQQITSSAAPIPAISPRHLLVVRCGAAGLGIGGTTGAGVSMGSGEIVIINLK